MALYNKRMNQQVYEVIACLENDDLEKDMGAYFGSILGTLNHILIGDLLWLSRFKGHSNRYNALSKLEFYPQPSSLNEVLYKELHTLERARSEIDLIIISWVSETEESDFEKSFTYQDTKGVLYQKSFGSVVGHFFNHQTHHRGQVSTLLCQLGKDVGVTDFIVDIPRKNA